MSDPLWEQAGRLHASRLFRTTSVEHAYAIILTGHELGLGATTALANISVIQGKPSLGAALVGALIKRSGRYDYRVEEVTDQRARVRFLQRLPGQSPGQEWEDIGGSEFSLDDAKRANLGGSQTWKSYPRNLLLSRALTNGARWYCPDVFAGAIYAPDELVASDATGDASGATSAATSAATSGATGNGAPTLEELLDRFGADAIVAANGGAIPATEDELVAVAQRLAFQPAMAPQEASDEPTDETAEVVG